MLTRIKRNKIKFVAFIVIIVLILAAIKAFGIQSLLSPTILRDKITAYGTIAPLVFILFYLVATILFLPGTPLTISGGLIFGKWFGTLYVVIGATIGATIAFILAKYLGEDFVEDMLKDKFKKLYEYDKKLEKNGILSVMFLRLVPIFPFNGLNFGLGLTRVKLKDFIIGTVIGIIPGSFALAFLGDSVVKYNIVNMVFAIGIFVVLAFIPTIYEKFKKQYKLKELQD